MSNLPPTTGNGGGTPSTLTKDEPGGFDPSVSSSSSKSPLSTLGLGFLKGLGASERRVNRGT